MTTILYTREEVLMHNNENDCWIIINNKVYNITKYLVLHPGGKKILLQSAGQDATKYFCDINHSKKAYKQLENNYIGNISTLHANKCNLCCGIM